MATAAEALADELARAYALRQPIAVPPSARPGGLDLPTGYAVEAELARRRVAAGHHTAGCKVGYANKAMWRALKLATLVWAHVYDDTVHYAGGGHASLPGSHLLSARIEPEIVFKLATPIPDGTTDPADALACVEWVALGFEIIDCPYADWKFQPADFVASYGLHAGLVVGEPMPVVTADIPELVEALAGFTVTLLKDDHVVGEGSGRNSLRSPALCLAELAAARARQPGALPLAAGELVSSGTLTESQPIAAGQRWAARVAGIELAAVSLDVT